MASFIFWLIMIIATTIYVKICNKRKSERAKQTQVPPVENTEELDDDFDWGGEATDEGELPKLESEPEVKQFLPRPNNFKEYVGNEEVKSRLKVSMKSAEKENRVLGHVLLYGPAGTGKTTCAKVLANELKYNFIETTAGTISTQTKMLQLLHEIRTMQDEGNNVLLFIDEIHRLARGEISEEIWFPVLENYCYYHDLKGEAIDLNGEKYEIVTNYFQCRPFTIVGATTDPGMLSDPLRDRFKISLILHQYTVEDLSHILGVYAKKRNTDYDRSAIKEIAKRGRGNPRQSISLFDTCRDFCIAHDKGKVEHTETDRVLNEVLQLDERGLSPDDIKVLTELCRHGEKGVGVKNLASKVQMNMSTLEEMIFPFLTWMGFMETSNRRFATPEAFEYLESKGVKIESVESKKQKTKEEKRSLF